MAKHLQRLMAELDQCDRRIGELLSEIPVSREIPAVSAEVRAKLPGQVPTLAELWLHASRAARRGDAQFANRCVKAMLGDPQSLVICAYVIATVQRLEDELSEEDTNDP